MYKFILRNGNKKRGKVLSIVYAEELLRDRVRKIANSIDDLEVDEWSYIDLEKNGRLLKTIYALDDGTFSNCDFDSLESFCDRLRK